MYKATDAEKYKEMNAITRRKIREAKERWLSEKCEEIEDLQKKYDSFNVHKKVKEFTGRYRKKAAAVLRDENNDIIVDTEAKLSGWKKYLETVFQNDRSVDPPEADDDGPDILREEVKHALLHLKNGKASGPDNLYAEVLKLIAEEEGEGLGILTSIFNNIYRSGVIPQKWLKSTFIALPKKTHASHFDDYRTISLMSHALKAFLRIIHNRIFRKCEEQIDEAQFGFRNGLGTREAIFTLNVLTQRCRDMNHEVYACFIDYRKAFDCIDHGKLLEVLRKTGIDGRDIRIISKQQT